MEQFPISDITSRKFDLSWKVLKFTSEIKRFESGSASKYILSPFGGDDNYRNAPATFGLLSLIVIYMKCNKERIGLDPKISSLKEYFTRLEQENLTLSKVTDDFFPVVDDYGKRGQNHTSWTGYFKTNPDLKHRSDTFIRNLRSMLSLTALNLLKDPRNDRFNEMHSQLEEFIMFSSLLVHHDTITGTSKERTLGFMLDKIRVNSEVKANIILDSLLAYGIQSEGNDIGNAKLVNQDPKSSNGRSKGFTTNLHNRRTFSFLELGPNNVQRQVLILNSLSPRQHNLVRLITKRSSTIDFPGALWKYASCMKENHCENVFLLSGATSLGMISQLS